MLDKNENWRPVTVQRFYGLYEISDLGRVRRIDSQRILKNIRGHDGYPVVFLSKDGSSKKFRVHILVALEFIGKRPEGKEVNHKNFNKGDPRPENLEYVTRSENARHAYRFPQRLAACPRGTNHANHKLDNENVAEIKRLLRLGAKQKDIAKQFNVCRAAIGDVNTGRTWKHI